MQAPEFSEKGQLFCVKYRVFLKTEAVFWIRAVWTKTKKLHINMCPIYLSQ